jgi:hypothetical protein
MSDVGSSSRADVEPPGKNAAAPAAPPPSEPSLHSPPPGDSSQSQLNLLGTVVPIVLKRYGPALAIVGLLLFIVIKIIRRKS